MGEAGLFDDKPAFLRSATFSQARPISGLALEQAGACEEGLAKFVSRYGWADMHFSSEPGGPDSFDAFIEYAKTQENWIGFLLEKEFITRDRWS